MEDKRETVLDPTYLRPGLVARSGAIALAALGIGAGVLLACWGASLFFTDHKRLDVLITKVEQLVQRPDRTVEVVAKLDNLDRNASRIGSNITNHLTSVEGSLEELRHRPIIGRNPDKQETTVSGRIINKEVTWFNTVPWDNGSSIITGWTYPNGASGDQRPTTQYCYWTSEQLGGTTSATRISIATNAVRFPNVGSGVPRLEEALKECVWWRDVS